MPFRVSGKNLDIGEALRERMSARIAEALSKYFDGGYSGHVTVEKEGFGFHTECAIHLDSGMTLHTDANAADAYASADQAAMRIEKRLRRYKHRLKDHQGARGNGQIQGQIRQDQVLQAPDRTAREQPALERTSIEAQSYVIAAPAHDGDEEEVAEWNPVIIAESTTTLRELSVG